VAQSRRTNDDALWARTIAAARENSAFLTQPRCPVRRRMSDAASGSPTASAFSKARSHSISAAAVR